MEKTTAVVLECKNCLKKNEKIHTRHPFRVVISLLVACGAGYIFYEFLALMYEWARGDVAIDASVSGIVIVFFLMSAIFLLCLYCIKYVLADFKRRDYWTFMDTFGRMHCDTVVPQFHKGRYYWQPLGNDLHLLKSGQTLSGEQLVITSTLIHWRVGGFSRSRGEIYHYRFTTGLWVFDGDNRITAFILPPRNPLTWQGSSITLENINHRNAITVPLLSFLRFTEEHNDKLNAWLSNNEFLERIAELLRDNKECDTATRNYATLGRFLVKMREMASKWPENSDYAKAMRKATDEFLLTMPDDDVKAWRRLEINEITGEPVSAADAPAENQPPEPPSDAAYCYSAEQIEQMKADLPQRKGI